jgi:class 3 adenylate cyclase
MPSEKILLNRPAIRGDATIMFIDIRGFSQLFDQRDPMEVFHFANSVLSEIGVVVEDCGGVVDKFTGDGLLAHFGILKSNTDHVVDACKCAIRIRTCVNKINLQRYIESQPIVSVGIGIHTGSVASGVISTSVKQEFTVFGSVVNFSSRLESLTKEFTVDCLASEAVFNAVQNLFSFQKMPFRDIRGFSSKHQTYWLLPTNIIN